MIYKFGTLEQITLIYIEGNAVEGGNIAVSQTHQTALEISVLFWVGFRLHSSNSQHMKNHNDEKPH